MHQSMHNYPTHLDASRCLTMRVASREPLGQTSLRVSTCARMQVPVPEFNSPLALQETPSDLGRCPGQGVFMHCSCTNGCDTRSDSPDLVQRVTTALSSGRARRGPDVVPPVER